MDYSTFMCIDQRVTHLYQHTEHLTSRKKLRREFLHHHPQRLSAQVFQHQVLRAPLLSLVQVLLYVWMAQAFADLCFTLVSLEDSRATDHIVIGKLEHNLLQRMPILGKVDMARPSSSKWTDDLVVINFLTRGIDCWHTSSMFFTPRPSLAARDEYRCPNSC